MKKIILGIAVLAVLAIAYWLILPLFIDKIVNGTLPTEREADVQQAIDAYKENIAVQVPSEKMAEFKKQLAEMLTTPDETISEPMPELTSVQKKSELAVVMSGSFMDVAHEGSGKAQIIDLGGEGMILRLVNLDVLNGPDLRVLLSKNRSVQKSDDLGEYIELGKLKGNKGNQNYLLPPGVDGTHYGSVIIYYKPFHVVFNVADIWGTESYQEAMEKLLFASATDADLVFGWEVEYGSFESIIFDAGGTYDTFLYQRPLESGSWVLTNGVLTLTSAVDDALNKIFTDVRVSNDKKTLQVKYNGQMEFWTRE